VKILFAPPQQGYTEEMLFYGLVEVLGHDNVVDYPRYETLRAAPPSDGSFGALCGMLFGAPEPDRSNMRQRVMGGEFDLIVVSNRSWHMLPLHYYDAVPAVFVDGEDHADRMLRAEAEQGVKAKLYFKREAYVVDRYIRPHPFSYPELYATPPSLGRPRPVGAIFTLPHYPRDRVIEAFEHHMPNVAIVAGHQAMSHKGYRMFMSQSRVGLDVRGFGYGCLRRVEVVGHGCVLCAQRLPIVMPHEFEHGSECFFFEDIRDAVVFVDNMTEDQYMDMAGRSWEKYLAYHTTKARAEQFLNDVENVPS